MQMQGMDPKKLDDHEGLGVGMLNLLSREDHYAQIKLLCYFWKIKVKSFFELSMGPL